MSNVIDIPLDKIKSHESAQPRFSQDEGTVERYAELYRSGVELPPIDVFDDGEYFWRADGGHRVEARRRAGFDTIKAVRHSGTLQEAQWFSLGANSKHGLQLTKDEKAAAIRAALAHPNSAGKSAVAIAEHLGVHHSTVSNYKKEGATLDNRKSTVVGKDGRTYDTTNIGRRASQSSPGEGVERDDSPAPADPPIENEQPTEADAQEHDAFWDDPPSESARPADEPAAPPTVILTDGVGGEVPERLWPIFQAKDRFDTLCNALSQVKKLAGELAEAEAGSYMRLDTISADVGNARSQIKHAAPYAVCPYCDAKKGKKCDACKGIGWVTKLIYDQAPDRDRSKDRKGTRVQ